MEGHYVSVHLGGYYRGQVYPQTPSHVIVFVARGDRKTVTHCERSAQQSRHASFGSGPHPFTVIRQRLESPAILANRDILNAG